MFILPAHRVFVYVIYVFFIIFLIPYNVIKI